MKIISKLDYKWLLVIMLWPVATLNYLDRQMLATMGQSIKIDIPEVRSAEMFGRLMAVFMWVYAFSSPAGGAFADRFNRKRLIIASLGVWSAVTLVMGKANTYQELYWLRGAMGLSEALYIPAALALIADYHDSNTRSRAIGIHLSGVYMGQALGGLGGLISQHYSWRFAFQAFGLIGVIYSVILMFFLKEIRIEKKITSLQPTGKSSVQWFPYILLVICFTLPSIPGWATKNWMPTLLQDRFHLDQQSSGLYSTLLGAGSAFVGVILGGYLADKWNKVTAAGRARVSTLGLILLAPCLVAMNASPNLAITLAFVMLYGLAFGMFDANNMPILCQILPEQRRSLGYGILNFAAISSGAYFTPMLGKMKDSGIGLGVGFAYCAIPAIIAAGLMFLLAYKLTVTNTAVDSQFA